MKKYLAFMTTTIKEEMNSITNMFSTYFAFIIHILMFSCLWDFVLEGKTMAGFTKTDLIWYAIMAEIITYSFNYYYKKVAYKIESGDFAYGMSKPYNFLARIIAEGIAELPMTIMFIAIGSVLGLILVGPLKVSAVGLTCTLCIILIAVMILLCLNILVGMISIWIGRDVSSIWLLIGKMMLIFAFTPLELFPKVIQIPLLCLPTTHVIYTPAKLFVHFSPWLFVKSLGFELISLGIIVSILTIVYMKGVKKQNVEGV
ncbi:MAG: ABC-2 family transporter protein [Clostridia bacterium]|nr:ABC-2 family transporter protein [Clostridia bacterium]